MFASASAEQVDCGRSRHRLFSEVDYKGISGVLDSRDVAARICQDNELLGQCAIGEVGNNIPYRVGLRGRSHFDI